MSWIYRHIARPLLFLQDSEAIHNRVLGCLAWTSQNRWACRVMQTMQATPELAVDAFGLRFPNPVGLAAGMDKQAAAVPAWAAMGFGFTELGGVTQFPQPGNSLPRMFRIIPDEGLINRMGFNNPGAETMQRCLKRWRDRNRWPNHPVAINLGKSKITPLGDARKDYARSFELLWELADFFVVNVSSPNTPQLRQLQDREALAEIIIEMQEVNRRLAQSFSGNLKPILIKVSPDLSWEALDDIIAMAGPTNVAGLVATNTTIDRPKTQSPELQAIYNQSGGLSGRPLRQRSTDVIRHLYRQTNGQLPIIGVGGIFSAEDAWEKVTAGACLVQLYSGLVYEGPGIVPDIVRGLKDRLGGGKWQDAVGSSNR